MSAEEEEEGLPGLLELEEEEVAAAAGEEEEGREETLTLRRRKWLQGLELKIKHETPKDLKI